MSPIRSADARPDVGPATIDRLSAHGLGFRYPGAPDAVLNDVTFEVHAGSSVGVLGPNGSGKSTLLDALLGVRAGERRGTVTIGGMADFDRRDVGYATQRTALYQQLTARENLRHTARLAVPRARVSSAVDASIEEFNLESVADTPVHALSGGWQRSVHIAASFVHQPPVRLLDEPTTALDFQARARLVERVDAWRRAGTVVVVTSHYPEDIEEMCTHAVLLRSGTVARQAPLAELLAGARRQLVIDLDGGPGVCRLPAPRTVADLATVAHDVAGSAELRGLTITSLRLTSRSLRDLLSADPELRGLLDDDV